MYIWSEVSIKRICIKLVGRETYCVIPNGVPARVVISIQVCQLIAHRPEEACISVFRNICLDGWLRVLRLFKEQQQSSLGKRQDLPSGRSHEAAIALLRRLPRVL